MKDLNWLADLVSDCHDFGEKHGNQSLTLSAHEVVAALERDFGLKFKLLPKATSPQEIWPGGLDDLPTNVVRMPFRPRKSASKTDTPFPPQMV